MSTQIDLFFGAKLQIERYPYVHGYDKVVFASGETLSVDEFIGTRLSKDNHILHDTMFHYYGTRLNVAADIYNSASGYLPFILARQKHLCLNGSGIAEGRDLKDKSFNLAQILNRSKND